MEAKEQGKVKDVKNAIDQRVVGAGILVVLFVAAIAYLSFFPGQQPGSSSATIKGTGGSGPGVTGTPVQVTSAEQATETLTDVSQNSAGIIATTDGILEDLTS